MLVVLHRSSLSLPLPTEQLCSLKSPSNHSSRNISGAAIHTSSSEAGIPQLRRLIARQVSFDRSSWLPPRVTSLGSIDMDRLWKARRMPGGEETRNPRLLEEQLREAAQNGNLETVQSCLAHEQVHVDARDGDGRTALHLASYHGHLPVVQYLIRDGKSNVAATKMGGWTALHLASLYGHLDVVQYLVLDGHADVAATKRDGWTALHLACRYGHLEVVQFLVQDGKADVDAKTNDGNTALHWASENGHLGVVQYLVRDGQADVNIQKNDGRTALHVASYYGRLEMVQCLTRDGNADVDAKENDGSTALHVACRYGRLEVVQYLVRECKADVEARTNDGHAALHCASENGHLDVVQYLLQKGGASFEAVTNKNKSALDLARQNGKENIVIFLSDRINSKTRANSSPMIRSITDPTMELPINQYGVANETFESNKVNFDAEIRDSRDELQRMLNEPMAEPTCWSIKYLEECTDNFNSKVLGEGAFGKVYFGCDKVLGFQFAVKRVPMTVPDPDTLNTIVDSFRREVLVLKRFRHPNIVALYGYNITMYGNCQFLVYEYLSNGALSGFLMEDRGRIRLPAHVRISIMFQVARAVHFLHTGGCDNLKILHRDVKSGNVCLTQDFTAKLIDCGMSKFVPDDRNMSHGQSVTPTMLKSSGVAVFGTPGYICPNYLRRSGRVTFTAACDVYSMGVVFAELIVGCLQDGQSSRNGQEFDDYHHRYVVDEFGEKVENGLEILTCDADPVAEWESSCLKPLCELTYQCMAPSPMRRPTTQELIQRLGDISKADFQGTYKNDPPQSNEKERIVRSKEMATTICVLCHESVVDTIKCSHKHATCIPCLEQRIQDIVGRTGDNVCCGIVGCGAPFEDECLFGKISTFTYNVYITERGLQRIVDQGFKELRKNHVEVMTSVKEVQSLAERSLKGLAFLATESVKKCPTLVWMVPAEPIVGRSARDWVKWAKSATSHRRYHVYFICQHSFSAFDLEPRMEIEVPRSWMVQVAPVLRLSLFAMKSALSQIVPLPFPVPDFLPKDQIAMAEELVHSFLDDTTTKMLATFESACTNGKDFPPSESSQLMTLTGPAYDGIVEKATKLKRTHWKQHMVPVMNHHGSLIWVKKEYQDLY